MDTLLRGSSLAFFFVAFVVLGRVDAAPPCPTACPVPSEAAIAQWEQGIGIAMAEASPATAQEDMSDSTSGWASTSDLSGSEPAELSLPEMYSEETDVPIPQNNLIRQGSLLERLWRRGFYAGCEFVWIKPEFARSEAFDLDERLYWQPGIEPDTHFNTTMQFSPRAQLGWRDTKGRGIRATYWHYDHRVDSQYKDIEGYYTGWIRADAYLEMQTLDLELTGAPYQGWWDFQVMNTLGVRYARHDQYYKAVRFLDYRGTDFSNVRHGFEGWGLTAGAELKRPLAPTLAFVGRIRGSIIWSDDQVRIQEQGFLTVSGVSVVTKEHETHGILEGAMGLEHNRRLGTVGVLTLRGTVEGQLWGDMGSPLFDGGNLGLFGLGISATLSR